MLKMIKIQIPIEPENYQRQRSCLGYRKGGSPFIQRYNRPEYSNYKTRLANHAYAWISRQSGKIKSRLPFNVPLTVGMNFYMSRTRKRGAKLITYKGAYPTALYDLDNLEKAVQDALEGIIWHNDKLICSRLAGGKYFADERAVGIEITIIPLDISDQKG